MWPGVVTLLNGTRVDLTDSQIVRRPLVLDRALLLTTDGRYIVGRLKNILSGDWDYWEVTKAEADIWRP